MSSFASAKGPSITVRFAPEYLTRQPLELAWSPEASSSTPALCISSWYLCISDISFSEGITPASESFVALTIIMNRIAISPFSWEPGLRKVSGRMKSLALTVRRTRPSEIDALRVRRRPLLFLLRDDLRAQALLLLPQLGGELCAEILRLEHLADLDLGILPHRTRAALDPFDRLFLRLHLPYPEASDQLLGLGEGPVDDGALGSREPDARALRARVQPFAREHHAGLHQLLVELPHRGEELLVGHHPGLRILTGFDYDHESHRVLRWVGSGASGRFFDRMKTSLY